jgi:hypothetical protein
MVLKTAFVTTERHHLVDLTRRLVDAIELERLRDPSDPIIVTVCGTYNSGKKIISDVAVELLLGNDRSLKGRKGFDEYWFNKNRTLEIDFIDSAFDGGYSSSKLTPSMADFSMRDVEKVSAFLRKRNRGGITFIQNGEIEGRLPSVEIWIERDDKDIVLSKTSEYGFRTVDFDLATRTKKAPKMLKEKFNTLSTFDDDCWVRYVEVKVNDKDLAQSQAMKDVLGVQPFWGRLYAAVKCRNQPASCFG